MCTDGHSDGRAARACTACAVCAWLGRILVHIDVAVAGADDSAARGLLDFAVLRVR